MQRIVPGIALAILFTAAAQAADAPTTTLLVITTQTMTGQRIEVPANPKVVATIVTIPPGAKLPMHKHPYARYSYILAGELTGTQLLTGKSAVHKQGDFLIEPRDQWHSAVNNGTVPVKLLVIDQVPEGATANTVIKDAAP
jgi:quercetin dioxygenase-like cupin family protein